MGANVSTQVATVTSTLQNVQNQSCQNESAIDQSIGNINVDLIGANCGTISFTNSANVNQVCDLSGTASALAQAATALTDQQKSSLSLSANVSTQVQDNTTKISNIINSKCGSASQINQSVKGANITLQPYVAPDGTVTPANCNILQFANSASAQQQCVLATVAEALSQTQQTAAATQTQESIGSLLSSLITGPLLLLALPVIAIIVIIVIVVIVKMLKKKPAEGDASALLGATGDSGGTQKCSQDASGKNYADPNGMYDCTPDQLKGGGRRRSRSRPSFGSDIRFENLPIVVVGIGMLVYYAKLTDPNNRKE